MNNKLYYIAIECLVDNEFKHFYTHKMCSEKNAITILDKFEKTVIEHFSPIKVTIKQSWYETVEF